MNILVLGCSWSAGLYDNPFNWVTALSEKCPEHNFYNLASPGSSVLHNIWLMENFFGQVSDHGIKIDKVIFQVTNEGRITYYNDLDNFRIKDWLIYKTPNLTNLEIDFQRLCCINYGTLIPENEGLSHKKWREIKSFATEYYSRLTRQQHFDLDHKIQVNYLKSRVDLLFHHKDPEVAGTEDVLCIEKILGKNEFNNFCMDRGSHFNARGCTWQAQWVKDKLGL